MNQFEYMVEDNIVELKDGIEVIDNFVEITTKDPYKLVELMDSLVVNQLVFFIYKNLVICYDTSKGIDLRVKGNKVQFLLQ